MARFRVSLALFQLLSLAVLAKSAPLVQLLMFLGDSILDAGTNNYLQTSIKCDHPPYGRIYPKNATGRWSDGMIVPDYIAQSMGVPSPLPFLNPYAEGENITYGINFASGGSGLLNRTSELNNVVSFSEQLQQFSQYIGKLAAVRSGNVTSLLMKGVYVINIGINDYLLLYFQNTQLQQQYTPAAFQTLLLQQYETYLRKLYTAGARMITVSGLPPLGCIPYVIALLGNGSADCVEEANLIAQNFNAGLKDLLSALKTTLKGVKFAYVDVYTALYSMIKVPILYGFNKEEVSKGCCGLGRTSVAWSCNASTPICKDGYEYIFFDAVHGTQHAYQLLAWNAFVYRILSLIFNICSA